MTQEIVEERVGALERETGALRTEQARQGEQLHQVRREVGELRSQGDAVLAGINDLRTRDAARPQPQSAKMILGTLATAGAVIAGLAGLNWWLIAVSPAVQEHERRLTKIDDPVDGQVARIKDRLHTLEGWQPQIVKK